MLLMISELGYVLDENDQRGMIQRFEYQHMSCMERKWKINAAIKEIRQWWQ